MLDNPPPALLAAEASLALNAGLEPGFPQKVAANALGILQRELEAGPAFAQAEYTRLVHLLAHDGELPALNAELCRGLRDGRLYRSDEALITHLIKTTVAKLSVDQPGYPGFRDFAQEP